MTDASTRLEQGGITTTAVDTSVPLSAVTYNLPGFSRSAVVRLVTEPLRAAEDISLGVFGLEPRGAVAVGYTRQRALGFPEWALVNDPDNAKEALAVVADLKRITRIAGAKPGRVKGQIVELATRLGETAAHFLPTFYEEAGRIYIAAGNTNYAAQMFTKAREAERHYGLLIDEQRHYDAVMEFTYAGAISAKELTVEAKSLAERLDPLAAYQSFRTLCVERVRGGMVPYSTMKRDLAKLAKAAGLNPADEEVGVAADLLQAGSIERAEKHFWENYDKAIRKAGAGDRAVQERLLKIFPEMQETNTWLDILRDTGALELVKDGAHASFVPRLIEYATRHPWYTGPATKLADVLAEILPHAGYTEISLSSYELEQLSAAALEHLLANGVTINLPDPQYEPAIDLASWVHAPEREPLPHLLSSEQLRKPLIKGLTKAVSGGQDGEIMPSDGLLRSFLIEEITRRVELLESAPPTVDRLVNATGFVRSFSGSEDTEVQQLLDRVRAFHRDPAEVLAETLRRGVPDELGWPEYDEKVTELKDYHRLSRTHSFHDCWPGVMAIDEQHLTHLRGCTTTDIPNWTGSMVRGATEVEGQFAVVYTDDATGQRHIWWSGSQENLVAEEEKLWLQGFDATVPVAGGRLCGEGVIVRPGQPSWGHGNSHFFVDGESVWLVKGDNKDAVVGIDPATGKTGRASLPEWFEEQCRKHSDLVFDPSRSQHRPVTEETSGSPYSTADGYHRHAVFTRPDDGQFCLLVAADGTAYTITGEYAPYVIGTLSRPGGGTWILAENHKGNWVLDPTDLMPVPRYTDEFPSFMWWHHTRVREPETSPILREITADLVQPLIDAAQGRDGVFRDDRLCQTVGKVLDISDPMLRYAIACQAQKLVASWPQKPVVKEDTPSVALPGTPTFLEHTHVLDPVTQYKWRKFDPKHVWTASARFGLHDRLPASKAKYPHFTNEWSELLGNGDALLALAVMPGRTREEVQGLKELWILLRETGLLAATSLSIERLDYPRTVATGQLDLPSKAVISGRVEDSLEILRADGGGPVTGNGRTRTRISTRTIEPSRTDLEPIFDAVLERIAADGPLEWSAAPGEAFAAAGNAPVTDAHLLMAGFPNFDDWEKNFLPKDLRTTMKLKVNDAAEARQRLQEAREHFLPVLAAGVPEDATQLLDDGLDAEAMAAYWAKHGTDYAKHETPEFFDYIAGAVREDTMKRVVDNEHNDGSWGEEVAAALWAASEVELPGALRAHLADYIADLQANPTGVDQITLEWSFSTQGSALRAAVGVLDRDPQDVSQKTLQSGRFTVHQMGDEDCLTVDLTDVTDPADPDIELSRKIAVGYDFNLATVAAAQLRAAGALNAYAAWLREPGAGHPRDPLAVVPDLVAQVADTLSVSNDAARYYLQLLAFADPTNPNVRRWNGWKKADIDSAGAELVEAGIAVEAKRPRAQRTFFLPGGWCEANAPHPPMELWKAESFRAVKPADRSKYEPMLGVAVPPLPTPEWFTECWERSRFEAPGSDKRSKQ